MKNNNDNPDEIFDDVPEEDPKPEGDCPEYIESVENLINGFGMPLLSGAGITEDQIRKKYAESKNPNSEFSLGGLEAVEFSFIKMKPGVYSSWNMLRLASDQKCEFVDCEASCEDKDNKKDEKQVNFTMDYRVIPADDELMDEEEKKEEEYIKDKIKDGLGVEDVPSIKMSELKERRFNLIDRSQKKHIDYMQSELSKALVSPIWFSTSKNNVDWYHTTLYRKEDDDMAQASRQAPRVRVTLEGIPEAFEMTAREGTLLNRYMEKITLSCKHMSRFLSKDDIVKYKEHACRVTEIDFSDYTVSLYDVESSESYGWVKAISLEVILLEDEWREVRDLVFRINNAKREEVEKKWRPGMMVKLTKDFTYTVVTPFGAYKNIIKTDTDGILVKVLSAEEGKIAFYGAGVHDVAFNDLSITQPSSDAWNNVILPEYIKDNILAVAQYTKDVIDKFPVGINKEHFHGLYPHLLLYGPPGNGKTAISLALGKKIGKPVLSVSGSHCQDVRVLGEMLNRAAEWNAIVFIDEFFHMTQECMKAMLSSLEHINTPIIMASNSTEMSMALASRIPVKLKIDYPDKEAMQRIWNIHLGEAAKGVDVDTLVEKYTKISGRDIKSAVVMAMARSSIAQPGIMSEFCTPAITTELLTEQLDEQNKFEEDRKSYKPEM